MVPVGSTPASLAKMATRRGWKIDQRNIRTWPEGSGTYFHQLTCRTRGGPVVPAMIAHYSTPLNTYVASLWLFDAQQRLADVCVRKDIDSL
jgi:hypothetical protein